MKRVILITGTPAVGKTTTATQLAALLGAQYINLTEYAKNNRLTLGEDKERKTTIIDEKALKNKVSEAIQAAQTDVVVDGHYAAAVVPSDMATQVFVLRRNPKELKVQMEKAGFTGQKLWENLSAEILDTVLIEALQTQQGKVCELDVTGKTTLEIVAQIQDVLDGCEKCFTGIVDWLGMLEREGLTDEYLKA